MVCPIMDGNARRRDLPSQSLRRTWRAVLRDAPHTSEAKIFPLPTHCRSQQVSRSERSWRRQVCWYRERRASGFVCLPLGATFCADLGHSVVDDALDLVRIGVSVSRLNVLNRPMKHTPTNGLFDEFR